MKILKFTGQYCAPCKALTKTFDSLNLSIEVKNIDIEEELDIVEEFKIKSVPTCILIDDNGKENKRWVGTFNVKEELKDFIE